MKELLEALEGWRADGADVGRAVVVRTFGSAPRPEGAVLLYAADGRLAGSVSGGCVEGAAAEEIERARADGHARGIRYGISDEQAWGGGPRGRGGLGTAASGVAARSPSWSSRRCPSSPWRPPRPRGRGAATEPPSSRRS